MSRDAKETIELEAAMNKIRKINEELSTGKVDLREGLKKFKEGARLVKLVGRELKSAENEFLKIKKELESDGDSES